MQLTEADLKVVPVGGEGVAERRAEWEARRTRWDAIRRHEAQARVHRRLAEHHNERAELLLQEVEA